MLALWREEAGKDYTPIRVITGRLSERVLMAGGPGLGGKVVKGVQSFQPKSKVVAEFVDDMPERPEPFGGKRVIFQRQEGFTEAMTLAMQNPGRAMLLLEYKDGPKSKDRSRAKARVMGMEAQGYSERNGWTVRAVENKVYVMYAGRGQF